MKKSLNDSLKELNAFFEEAPTANQKAWGIIHQFYHLILTYMEKNNIKQVDLAKKLGKSRAAISQMFSKTPNISIKKMVEIADAIGLDLEISSPQVYDQLFLNKYMDKGVMEFSLQTDYRRNWIFYSAYSTEEVTLNSSHGLTGSQAIELNAYAVFDHDALGKFTFNENYN